MTLAPPQPPAVTVRRLAEGVRQRRIRIGLFVFGVTAATVVWALFQPNWYRSQTTLLPPTEGADAFSNLAGMIQNSALNRVGLFTTSTASDVYVEILTSRRLRESLARQFDLQRLYKTKGMDRTLKELKGHITVGTSPSGVVIVSAEDLDRQRAANMANFLVSELDRFNRETLTTRGKSTRQFLETRLADVEGRMHAAESTLTMYEQRNKLVVGGEESAVRGIADVVAQKLSLQVRRSYVESYAPGSSSVHQIDAEIAAFERELGRLPGLKNEGARLALEAEIQRKVFTLLTAQYEQARLEERRDTPTVTVLDVAQPAEIKFRPKRSMYVLAAMLAACAVAVGWTWFSLWRTARAT